LGVGSRIFYRFFWFGAGKNCRRTKLSADGTWTLCLADLSVGGGTSTLDSWGLDVTSAIPEPATCGMLAGAGLLVVSLCRQFRRKQKACWTVSRAASVCRH
jgi:hypothetical protein